MTLLVKDNNGNVILEKELQAGEKVCEIQLNELEVLKNEFTYVGAYH